MFKYTTLILITTSLFANIPKTITNDKNFLNNDQILKIETPNINNTADNIIKKTIEEENKKISEKLKNKVK